MRIVRIEANLPDSSRNQAGGFGEGVYYKIWYWDYSGEYVNPI